jgi:hypothetical protein
VTVTHGEVEDPAVAVRNWPLPPAAEQGAGEARQAGAAEEAERQEAKIEKGRDVAVIEFPASHGVPALRVSMIQELAGYKTDLPNSVSGEQLYRGLTEQLNHAADAADHWPASVDDAQVAIAHHVFAGLYGVRGRSGQ